MTKVYPTTRLVFDRKHVATKEKKGLVQLEVLYLRRRKWISTGIKVYADQWSDRNYIVRAMDSIALNDRLVNFKSKVDDWINELISEDRIFTWDALEEMLSSVSINIKQKETFLQYVERRIDERNDITESTKKNHRKLIASLEKFGRIVSFSDLTRANIADYYNYLQGIVITKPDGSTHTMMQQTVYSYMKFLKVYINDAIKHDIMRDSPMLGLKIKRGESEQGKWLSVEELQRIEVYKPTSMSMQQVKDLFLVQCYSGLAYADLMNLSTSKIEDVDGVMTLSGERVKTHEPYFTAVLPALKVILEKYNYKLPKLTQQPYNLRLKILADAVGIDKPLASHWGRRTCGMLMLNKGYPIEIVAKVLGHSDIRTTQKAYAHILNKTVVEAFKKIEKL
jgi:site-specific recombinase XerD